MPLPCSCHTRAMCFFFPCPCSRSHAHRPCPRISRHRRRVTVADAKVCLVGQSENLRFRQYAVVSIRNGGASTPADWTVLVVHIRSGNTIRSKIPGSGIRAVKFKKDILNRALLRSIADASASTPGDVVLQRLASYQYTRASTRGIVLGDLNMTKEVVEDLTRNFKCPAVESIGIVGGEGTLFLTMIAPAICHVIAGEQCVSPCSCHDIAMLLL